MEYFKINSEENGVIRKNMEEMIQTLRKKEMSQKWNRIYDEEVQKYSYEEHAQTNDQKIPFEEAKVRGFDEEGCYFERYRTWKASVLHELYIEFKKKTLDKMMLVCSACWPKKLYVIGEYSAMKMSESGFILKTGGFQENIFCRFLFCPSHHTLGTWIEEDTVEIRQSNVGVYIPGKQIFDLADIKSDKDIKKLEQKYVEGLEHYHK